MTRVLAGGLLGLGLVLAPLTASAAPLGPLLAPDVTAATPVQFYGYGPGYGPRFYGRPYGYRRFYGPPRFGYGYRRPYYGPRFYGGYGYRPYY